MLAACSSDVLLSSRVTGLRSSFGLLLDCSQRPAVPTHMPLCPVASPLLFQHCHAGIEEERLLARGKGLPQELALHPTVLSSTSRRRLHGKLLVACS